jgi:hypothetical protein
MSPAQLKHTLAEQFRKLGKIYGNPQGVLRVLD